MDEDNEDDRVAKALTGAGMTVVKATPAGNSGKPDEEQFAFAVENSLVVYTSNFRDFNVLQQIHLAAGLAHSGMIIRTGRRWSAGEQAKRIIRIWNALSAEEMVNRVESLSRWGEERA
jgi:hypothetical protein